MSEETMMFIQTIFGVCFAMSVTIMAVVSQIP